MSTELEKYKAAIKIANQALIDLNGAENSLYTGPRASCAIEEINEILNPPPIYEDIPVVRWECNECGYIHTVLVEPVDCDAGMGCTKGFTKLTGTRRIEKPAPVERSVSVEAQVSDGAFISGAGYVTSKVEKGGYIGIAFYNQPECHGKKGVLTFTWTEQP